MDRRDRRHRHGDWCGGPEFPAPALVEAFRIFALALIAAFTIDDVAGQVALALGSKRE